MAAPTEASILDLTGNWQMDKTLSDDWDPILQLQGMSWLLRKALGLATVTLGVTVYKDDDGVQHLDIAQTLTGGIQGTTEKRILNWSVNDHTDHIFGHVKGQSRLIRGAENGGKLRPDVEVQTRVGVAEEDETLVPRFLRGEILPDGKETEGFIPGEGDAAVWLQSFVRSQDNGWTAEQVWGFEEVGGERRYTRRVVVAKDGEVRKVRLVYSYLWDA